MRTFGVVFFVVGVSALSSLVIRRGRDIPLRWPDYALMFIGIAGAIVGLSIFFIE